MPRDPWLLLVCAAVQEKGRGPTVKSEDSCATCAHQSRGCTTSWEPWVFTAGEKKCQVVRSLVQLLAIIRWLRKQHAHNRAVTSAEAHTTLQRKCFKIAPDWLNMTGTHAIWVRGNISSVLSLFRKLRHLSQVVSSHLQNATVSPTVPSSPPRSAGLVMASSPFN